MTGFVGQSNPLSAMSIQSLGDVGYSVNQSGADAYTIPGQSAARMLGAQAELPSTWESLTKPQFEMTRGGRVTKLEKQ